MKFKYIYQLFISHISIIIVAFLVLSLMFTQYVETLVYQNKVDELTTYGKNILNDLDQPFSNGEQIISQYRNVLLGQEIEFSVFDEGFVIIGPVGKHVPLAGLTKEDVQKITNGDIVAVKRDFKRFNQEVSFVVLPFLQNGHFFGGILLTSPISGSREMISQINQYLFYTVLIALSVSFLLSWLLSKLHVNRIKRIQEATSMVAAGDYTVNVPTSNFDEIGELAQDFNQMVDKLNTSREEIENLENRRRKFISDVSHELKTPLTTISGVIEGLKNNMIPEGEKEKGIQLVSKESKRLIRLVNENLDYDKIRSNQIKLEKVRIQLREVLEIIKEQLSIQADEKNNQLIVEVEDSIFVNADYDRLIQILINITQNSIQFTRDGTIWLRGKTSNNDTIIEVEDTGIGIEPDEVELIWHRFYKADISRTNNPYGEFGLGLSIVKQLVALHHGTIEVFSERNYGTKFVIRLPN